MSAMHMNVSYLLRGGSRHCRWKFLGQLSHFAIFPEAPPHMQQLSPPAAYTKNQQVFKRQIGMRSNDNKNTTLSPRKRSFGSSRMAWLWVSQRTLLPPPPPIIITWPSKWIAWQANTTLVSYANILYVRQHMTLHKDCVTSQQNVSIHHKGSFSS